MLWKLWLLGIATSTNYACWMVLSSIIIIIIIIIIKFKTGQNMYMPLTILSVHPYWIPFHPFI